MSRRGSTMENGGRVPGIEVVDRITKHLTSTRFEDLPKSEIELAKWRVLDVLGCAFGGGSIDGNLELLDLFQTWGGAPQATVIGHGLRLPVHHVAYLNSMMARSNDFEVMTFWRGNIRQPSHNSASTVPTALAVAESRGLSGRDMLTAMILGEDLAGRVALSANWNFYLGADGLGTLVPWGTTAVAGRLIGLDALQMRHAFGLAINMMSGTVQDYWDGVHAIKVAQAVPSHTGVISAELAARGWTGVTDPLFAEFGYFRLFASGSKDPAILTDGLGEDFYTERIFKPYPSGLPTHRAIDCALALHAQGVRADEVESITIELGPTDLKNYYAKPFEIRYWPHGDAAFSFQYTVCAALYYGALSIEHFTEEVIRSAELRALIGRSNIAPHADPDTEGTVVRVRLKSGDELAEHRRTAKGDRDQPMTEDDIIAKFRHQVDVSQAIDQDSASRLIDAVCELDTIEDLGIVTRLAAGTHEREQ